MQQHPMENKDYLFQMIFIYRNIIPVSNLFYYFFFGIKFLGVYLLTHNIHSLEDHLFTFQSVLRRLAFLSNGINNIHTLYETLSIAILVILIVFILLFLLLVSRFKRMSLKTQQSLISNYNANTGCANIDCKFIKTLSLVFLIIVFLSQHIVEYLLFSIIPIVYSKSDSSNGDNDRNALELFIAKADINHYILLGINSLSIIIVMSFNYIFLYISSSLSLETNFGFNYNLNHFNIIIWMIIFQLQSCYTMSNYLYHENNYVKFYLCIVSIVLLLICCVINFKQYNHARNNLCFYINCIISYCLLSGIIELIMAKILTTNLNIIDSIIKELLLIINSIGITILISKHKLNKLIGAYIRFVFTDHSSQIYEALEEYSYVLCNHVNSQSDFILNFQILEMHRLTCQNNICLCHRLYKLFNHTPLEKKMKKMMEIFISICEHEIVMMLNRSKGGVIKKYILQRLYLLHVDFVLTVKKNYYLALYLAKYYQELREKDLDYFNQYKLFEVQETIIERFNNRREACDRDISKQKFSLQPPVFKNDLKQRDLLLTHLFNEHILNAITKCVLELEKFGNLRNNARIESKLIFTCEDFLSCILNCIKHNEETITLLDNFLEENKKLPSASIEISYLLQYFFLLYKNKIPDKYQGRFALFPRYTDYLHHNTTSDSNMIIYLTNNEEAIIEYMTISLIDDLHFLKEEIIGADFHNKLVPSYLSSYHFIFFKAFILQGNTTIKKNCFLLNKERDLVSYDITSKSLPSLTKRLCLIAKTKDHHHTEMEKRIKGKASTYFICLDLCYNLIATSRNFTQNFLFSIDMFHKFNLNFCRFFGLKEDELTKLFKTKTQSKFNGKMKETRLSLMTTIPRDKELSYENVLDYMNYINEPSIEEYIVIQKKKLIYTLRELDNKIEELGLNKEFKDKVKELYNRQGNLSSNDLNVSAYNISFTALNGKKGLLDTHNFTFLFRLKHIGNLYYYIVIFSDKYMSPITTAKDLDLLNDEELKSKELTILLNNKSSHVLLDEQKRNLFLGVSKDSSFNSNEPSRNNLNQSSNNSFTFLNNNIAKSFFFNKFDMTITADKNREGKVNYEDIIKMKAKVWKVKILQYISFIILVALNITNFSINSTYVNVSLNLFYINIYSFLLSSDIFFGSLGSIRACFIKEGLQNGSLDLIQKSIYQDSTIMLEDFQNMIRLIHQMTDSDKAKKLYSILIAEEEYQIMLPNWEIISRNTSLIEEIYFLHYSLIDFDIIKSKSCRLNTFITHRQSLIPNTHNDQSYYSLEPSHEEKIIMYIIFNIISKVSLSLYKLVETTDNQLFEYSDEANINLILFNSLLLAFAFILYLLLMIYILKLKSIFTTIITQLLFKEKGENEFNADIERYKNVLLHFGKNECRKFEGKASPYNLTSFDSNFLSSNAKFCLPQKSSVFITHNTPTTKQSTLKKKKNKLQKNGQKVNSDKQNKTNISSLQIEIDPNNRFNKTVDQMSNLKFMSIVFAIIIISFLSFSSIQLANIFISNNTAQIVVLENTFTTYYLLRIPKFAELVLYAEITVITQDLQIINPSEIDFELINIYNIPFDTQDTELLALQNKYYVELFNQLFLIRNTLGKLFNDRSKKDMFNKIRVIDTGLQGNEFCLELGKEYANYLLKGNISSWAIFYTEANIESKSCNTVSGGMNTAGLKLVFNLLNENLNTLYASYEKRFQESTAQKDFLMAPMLEMIVDDLQSTMKTVHIIFAYNIIHDMERSYHNKYQIEILFSIASIIFSCGFFLILSVIIMRTFERYNVAIESFWITIDKAIKSKQNTPHNYDSSILLE